MEFEISSSTFERLVVENSNEKLNFTINFTVHNLKMKTRLERVILPLEILLKMQSG